MVSCSVLDCGVTYSNNPNKETFHRRLLLLASVALTVLCGDGAQGILALKLPLDTIIKDGDSFEYIVVGAGAAGVPAASRLALAGANVLLIEAGGNPKLLTRIPGGSMLLLGSDVDWQYPTLPNNVSCLSAIGQGCRFSRGKCLGGSSSINYMMYTRGNRQDYDELNITGWAWKDVEPYFLYYEGLQDLDKLPASSIPYHNTSGTLKAEYFTDSGNAWHARFFEGLEDLNVTFNIDVNAQSQIGTSQVFGYVYENERMSTARAYLTDAAVKKKIKVSRYTTCTGVIIDVNNVARGVTVEVGPVIKRKKTLYATKEVILCAGTIGTPQILMLSGIGPADHLNGLGITVRADLPVGDDMSDHVLPLVFMLVDSGYGVDAPNILVHGVKGAQAVQWLATKSGPLASNGLTDATLFINTLCYDYDKRQLVNNSTDCELPSLQLINSYIDRNLISAVKPVVKNFVALNDAVIEQLSDANVHHAVIVSSPVVLRPHSRGTVRLASTNPKDLPAIKPNYLADDRDVEEMLRSITILEHLVETPIYKKNNASILHLNFDDCPTYCEANREAYWRCYVRHMTYSVFHAVGTCALRRVVDEKLRVYGVRGLRVADLSVLPLLPRGNTEAIAIAVGERAAHFILSGN